MRYAYISAALVAGALAVPFNNVNKRDVITQTAYNVVYTTDVVTVTAGSAPDSTPKAQFGPKAHFGHEHKHHWPHWNSGSGSKHTSVDTDWAAPTTTVLSTREASPTAKSSPAPSLGGSAGSSYQDIAVYHHNIHRQNHSAPDIAWDAGLEKSAADVAASCIYEHNTGADGGGYGQNIAAGVPPDNISAIITDLFYNGEVNYYAGYYGMSQPPMTNFEHWGHFSQIVWKATTHVGCATQDCSGKGLANTGGDVSPYFTVCNYKSAGNYENEYGSNVGSPQGMETASWDAGMNN